MDTLVKIAGLLGFIISVATFVLTRIERKKRIEIEIFDEMGVSFPNLVGWPEEIESDNFMKVRFTNLGTQTVIIKPRTLQVEYQDKVFVLGNEDFIGMDEFDEVLIPMSSRSIGVFQSMILSELDITSPKTYDDESFNKLYPLKISVQDHHGKKFTNKRYSYHEAVCEYVI